MTDKPNTEQGQQQEQEVKFTQADIDKIVQKRLSEQKTKFEQMLEEQKKEAEHQAELAQMDELQRTQTELEDFKTKYQAEADKNALAIQKDDLRKYMSEKEVSCDFLDFLLKEKDMDMSKANVDNFKKVFDDAVQKAVEAKIPAHIPNAGNSEPIDAFLQGFNETR